MLHTHKLWHFGISVTLLYYPQRFHRFKFVIIPHVLYRSHICEILLHSRQLVVLTYELIYIVRLLTARGKIIVKRVYCVLLNATDDLALALGAWNYNLDNNFRMGIYINTYIFFIVAHLSPPQCPQCIFTHLMIVHRCEKVCNWSNKQRKLCI